MFKALTLILQLVNHRICGLNQVWVIQVGYCSTLQFLFFFYWFSIFPGYHYVGGRGVLKVETKKWQSQGQSSPLVSWAAALSKPMHHALIFPH